MQNYDFQILQPNEFECLTRDLLQKRDGLFIESFAPGRDDGIDMRYASAKSAGKTIVQAKRYKDYRSLYSSLQKEIEKVRRLEPRRYIVSTSVDLTPSNKDAIYELFSPYIQTTADILGRADLNNLLGEFPEIEKRYYKLWLSSSAVLDKVVCRRIENWSAFERDDVEKTVSTYVMNASFDEALAILCRRRYVIISGIPGIGKTTLARMLIYKFLGETFEEVIRISSMDDAAAKLEVGRNQVFFFDDFLGSNFLQVNENGFDSKLLRFIEAVQRDRTKLLILSTREYILSEAIAKYERFAIHNIELAKCTINMSNYTEEVRAHILYNHLASHEIPSVYLKELLFGNQYLRIIRHKNFNPRILETFLNNRQYENNGPEKFVHDFLYFFDHPLTVWEYAYRNLSEIAQYALLVRMTMGSGTVFLSDWYYAVKCFVAGTCSELNLSLSELLWADIVRVLDGTFITILR